MNSAIYLEYQDLIRRGEVFYFDSLSPLAEIVTDHARRCQECRELVLRLARERYRRNLFRFNPFKTYYIMKQIRRDADYSEEAFQSQPIARVASTIIQRALRINADAIRLTPGQITASEAIFERKRRQKSLESMDQRPASDLIEMMKEDIRKAGAEPWAVEGTVSLRVEYRVNGEWNLDFLMPVYIIQPLALKIRAMAEVSLIETGPQQGRISVQYESRNYEVGIICTPSELGDVIQMEIHPQ